MEINEKDMKDEKVQTSVKFFKIYFAENFNIESVLTLCYGQNLSSVNLRPLVWRLFLNLLPITTDKLFKSWLMTTQEDRYEFFLIKEKFSMELYNPDLVIIQI